MSEEPLEQEAILAAQREPVEAVEGSAPVERRPVTVLEAHTLADCADPAACWWLPHQAGASTADQSLPSAPRDGLAASDEAIEALNNLLADHPMWVGDDGRPLEFHPLREERISRFIEDARPIFGALAARVRAEADEYYAKADHADLTDAFREMDELSAQLSTVRAEAVAEHRADLQHRIEVSTRYENDRRVALAERDEYHRNWQEAEKRTAKAVEEAVAEERQRVEKVRELHPPTSGDDGEPICATCVNLGEHDPWPCATLLVLAAGSVPVATPLDDDVDRLRSIWRESPHTRSYVEDRYPGLAHAIERAVMHAEPVATPAEPGDLLAVLDEGNCEHGNDPVLCGKCDGPEPSVAEPSVGTGTPAEEVSGGDGDDGRWEYHLTAEVVRSRAAIEPKALALAIRSHLRPGNWHPSEYGDKGALCESWYDRLQLSIEGVLAAALGDGPEVKPVSFCGHTDAEGCTGHGDF